MKVSIITPAYNLERYIEKCIKSVLDQTFQNWEQIIIDDYSSDSTPELILRHAQKDKRIKFLKHRKRWGIERLVETYNQALSLSEGDLIAILEGDDFWPPYKLSEQVEDFKDEKIIVSYGDCIVTDSNGMPYQIRSHFGKKNLKWLNNDPPGSILYAFSDLNFFLEPSTAVIRKKALMGIGGFKGSRFYPFFVDIPTWPELALKGKFRYNHKILGYYRRHTGSFWFYFAKDTNSMGRQEMHRFFRDFIRRNKNILNLQGINVDEKELEKEHKEFIRKKIKRKSISLILHNAIFNNRDKVIKMGLKILGSRKEGVLTKIMVLLVILALPFYSKIVFFTFHVQLLLYKLGKAIKSERVGSRLQSYSKIGDNFDIL